MNHQIKESSPVTESSSGTDLPSSSIEPYSSKSHLSKQAPSQCRRRGTSALLACYGGRRLSFCARGTFNSTLFLDSHQVVVKSVEDGTIASMISFLTLTRCNPRSFNPSWGRVRCQHGCYVRPTCYGSLSDVRGRRASMTVRTSGLDGKDLPRNPAKYIPRGWGSSQTSFCQTGHGSSNRYALLLANEPLFFGES